jgi:serine protease Do
LGDSSNLTVGQTVIAIGNPLGDLTGTVTSGIISGLNREVEVGANFFNTDVEAFEDVIQTDAAINPGNSGGPLINTNGEVIGVNFATIQGADNLSFAIPIDRVKLRIDELNQFGDFRIPFMGIEYRRRVVFIDDEALIGALVTSVFTSSPADKAGVEIGDVIVQYDDKTLEEESLFSLIQKSEIGEAVKIIVIRDGEQVSLDVVIGQQSKVE